MRAKINNMRIFLDDIREPKDCIGYMHHRIGANNLMYLIHDWCVVRNYGEFKKALEENIDEITHISFDHDLHLDHYSEDMYSGSEEYNKHYEHFKEKTGKECAEFMCELYYEKNKEIPTIFIHSMNPVGVENIKNVINDYEKFKNNNPY